MCGIAGIWRTDGGRIDPALLVRMTDLLAHRGPDDAGYVLLDSSRRLPPIEGRPRRPLPADGGEGRDPRRHLKTDQDTLLPGSLQSVPGDPRR